jgi:ASC-1-like (ASCH) protein
MLFKENYKFRNLKKGNSILFMKLNLKINLKSHDKYDLVGEIGAQEAGFGK